MRPYLKNPKKAGGMAQDETLSSNSSTAINK
jgi:hypothetical protein